MAKEKSNTGKLALGLGTTGLIVGGLMATFVAIMVVKALASLPSGINPALNVTGREIRESCYSDSKLHEEREVIKWECCGGDIYDE